MSNSFVADDIDDSVIGTSKIFKFCIRLDLWSRKTGLIGITVPFVFVNYEIFGSIFIFSILGFPTFVNILTYQLRECKRLTCFKNDKNFSWMVKRVRFFTWRGSRFGPAIKRPPQISVALPIRNRRPLEKIFRNWGQGRPSLWRYCEMSLHLFTSVKNGINGLGPQFSLIVWFLKIGISLHSFNLRKGLVSHT